MAIPLDHLIVPAKDRVAAARQLGTLLGVGWAEQGAVGPFSPVYVSDSLTIDFDQWEGAIPRQRYCFRVSPDDFDAILGRIRAAGIACRSLPHGSDDGQRSTGVSNPSRVVRRRVLRTFPTRPTAAPSRH
jgi:hypothetical protein